MSCDLCTDHNHDSVIKNSHKKESSNHNATGSKKHNKEPCSIIRDDLPKNGSFANSAAIGKQNNDSRFRENTEATSKHHFVACLKEHPDKGCRQQSEPGPRMHANADSRRLSETSSKKHDNADSRHNLAAECKNHIDSEARHRFETGSKHQNLLTGESRDPSPSRRKKAVMIAMDGSGHSFYAFDWYMSQMHTPETEVIVAHSSAHQNKSLSHVQSLMPSVITSDPSSMSRIIQQEEEEVNKIVSQIKGKLTQAGVRGKLLRLTGEPGAAIIQAAQDHMVHCIVTGSRGLGTVRRTLIGSVSDYILHHAHCPVLVCRHKET